MVLKIMKRLFRIVAVSVLMLMASCINEDFNYRLSDLEKRVSALEELCSKMNTNISSLQTLVTALQQNDYITSVTPVKEGDVVIGYTISFVKNSPITIYHGKDGADGKDGTDGAPGKVG